MLLFLDHPWVIPIMGLNISKPAEELCRTWLDRIFYRYENNLGGFNALISQETGKIVGQCGLLIQTIDEVDELEIGYSLLPEFWHRGFATEAAVFCKYQAFSNNFAEHLISIIRPKNLSSGNVARKNEMQIE